ncbi:MAG: DUF362 domain-containing protein [Proteobacteria bacterium]|nr:DUF362 domain-containing protein [Pseudomonadota bacterium]MBU1584418.1 DUF362 domain-containing protein [Pseudomonadota bacterium]MBU2452952.1 DUF362 domain-containing protein [Pseudomonadota bacterium]MBU2628546.1 DUF362 domain-containing protein [Pseudomonadota bacterium]
MDRRKFLKQLSLWSAGVILTPPVFNLTPNLFGSPLEVSDILVAKGEDYSGMVQKIVSSLGGMQAFVKTGDTVVIKPNIGWDRTVEQGANTHPVIVVQLAKLCLDAGASKVLVFDRTCNEERRCYTNSGIKSALKEIGDNRIRMDYIDDRKFIPVTIKKGIVLKEWSFYKDALKADCYINVPVAKHHSLSGLSLGLKNIMGVIGGRRGRIHYQLGAKLADLNMVIKPDLTIVDATRVIVRNGPQGGDLKDVKKLDTIVGSLDPVAVDAYATTLFGLKPHQVEATLEAYKRGLGQIDLDKCSIRYLKA